MVEIFSIGHCIENESPFQSLFDFAVLPLFLLKNQVGVPLSPWAAANASDRGLHRHSGRNLTTQGQPRVEP